MKVFAILAIILAQAAPASADLSYQTTRKVTGGIMAQHPAAKVAQVSSHYLKGQKMAVVNQARVEIFDFDAHTITYLYKGSRRYMVAKLSDLNGGTQADPPEARVEAKQTGHKKIVGGFEASELVLTVEMSGPRQDPAGKIKMEIDMWLSTGAPGSAELRDFYRRNANKLPWAAIGSINVEIPLVLPAALDEYVSCFDWYGCGGDPRIEANIDKLQSNIASMEGVPVEQVIRVTAPAGPAVAAFIAGSSGSSGPLIEMTMDSSDFSTSSVPDSVFVIPDGYKEGPPDLNLPNPKFPQYGDPLARIGPAANGPGSGGDTGSGSGGIYRVGGGVTAPVALVRPEPEYSEEARKAACQGSVLLYLVVDSSGSPRNLKVLRGIGFGLDEKAIEAVEKWQFRAGYKDGKPVNVAATVEVNFRLLDKDRTGQRASLIFTLPLGAGRPVLVKGKIPPNQNSAGQRLRVSLTVNSDGTPKNLAVIETTDAAWADRALRDLRAWRFTPASVNAEPVAVEGVFELAGEPARPPATDPSVH
ncbi:MAG: TonB family protein [Bryobacteraceae bacterium]|jgi:TonB family protein